GDQQAEVSWTAAGTNGAGAVQRYVVTAKEDVTKTCTGGTSCVVEGLTNDMSYTFTVRASNTLKGDLGWSAPSVASTAVKPLKRGPGAPTITDTKLGNASATVSFTEGTKTYGNQVNSWEGSTDGTTWKQVTAVGGPTNAMETTFTGLLNGESNSLYLRGVSAGGKGDPAVESVTPLDTLPAAPSDLAAEPADEGATLTFTTPAGPVADKFEVTVDNGVNWQDFAGAADGKGVWTGKVGGLTNGTPTMIRLRGVIGAETGTYVYANVTPGVPASAPADVTATPGDGQVTIEFTEPDPGSAGSISGYQVKLDDGEWWEVQAHQVDTPPLARIAGDKWTFTRDGLTNGTSYLVQVRASTSVGPGAPSTAVKVTPQGKPTAPRELTATADDNSAKLTFLPSENDGGATGFTYQVSTDQGGKWATITTAAGAKESLTATVTGLTNGQDAVIWLRANNSVGASDHIVATVTPASPSPSASSSSPTPSPSVSSSSPTPKPSVTTPTVTPTTTKPTVTPTTTTPTVTPTTVTPTTASPTPSPSATATSSPTPSPSASAIVPLAPSGVTVSAGVSSITVSWSAPTANGAKITGYRATASPGPATCTTSGTSCVLGGASGTAYTVSVVALSAAGSSPSASSSSVTPTAPPVSDTVPATDLPLETPDGETPRPTPGGTMTISGDGYAPFSTVTLAVYSTPTVLGTATADGDGKFTATITVPPGLSMGKHSFVAAGVDENGNPRALRLDLTVAPAGEDGDGDGGSLPVTGSPVLWMLVAGFASILTGVALRRIRREAQ
ncbi:MAG: fibronectin type III domain-containing protein, partial [Actinoplanes sp.]